MGCSDPAKYAPEVRTHYEIEMLLDTGQVQCALLWFCYAGTKYCDERGLVISCNNQLYFRVSRVATAQGKQGKQGIWFLLFPDRENTGNLPKNIKNMILHREFTFNTGKILKFQKLNVKPGLWWNIAIKFWLFDAKFQLVDNTIEFL